MAEENTRMARKARRPFGPFPFARCAN